MGIIGTWAQGTVRGNLNGVRFGISHLINFFSATLGLNPALDVQDKH